MRHKPANVFSEKYPRLHACYPHLVPHVRPVGWEVSCRRYAAMLEAAKGFLPHGNLYLNSVLNNMRVTAIDWERKSATIWFDDKPMRCFYHFFSRYFHEKVNHWDAVIPLGMRFHDVTELTVSRISSNNKVLPLKKARYLPLLSRMLDDEARVLSGNRVELGMIFSCDSQRGDRYFLLLEVSCKRIEFIEQRREHFFSKLGGRYLETFDRFWEARVNGTCFDYIDPDGYVKEWKLTDA